MLLVEMGLYSKSLTGQKTTVCGGHHGEPEADKGINEYMPLLWKLPSDQQGSLQRTSECTLEKEEEPSQNYSFRYEPSAIPSLFLPPNCKEEMSDRGKADHASPLVAGAFFNWPYLRKRDYLPLNQRGRFDYYVGILIMKWELCLT